MHQYKDKKKNILFIFLIIFFLTSINSQLFVEKKKSFYSLQNIEVEGLDVNINLELHKTSWRFSIEIPVPTIPVPTIPVRIIPVPTAFLAYMLL